MGTAAAVKALLRPERLGRLLYDLVLVRGQQRVRSTAATLSALYHEVTLTAELAEKRKAVELKYSHLKTLRLRADEATRAHELAREALEGFRKRLSADVDGFQPDPYKTAEDEYQFFLLRDRRLKTSEEWKQAIAAENHKNTALQARDAAAAEYYDALHEKNEAQQLFDSAFRLIQTIGSVVSFLSVIVITPLLTSYTTSIHISKSLEAARAEATASVHDSIYEVAQKQQGQLDVIAEHLNQLATQSPLPPSPDPPTEPTAVGDPQEAAYSAVAAPAAEEQRPPEPAGTNVDTSDVGLTLLVGGLTGFTLACLLMSVRLV